MCAAVCLQHILTMESSSNIKYEMPFARVTLVKDNAKNPQTLQLTLLSSFLNCLHTFCDRGSVLHGLLKSVVLFLVLLEQTARLKDRQALQGT